MALGILALLGSGCGKLKDSPKANQPPEVFLSSGPPNGDPNVNYKVHFYWNGYDPDGRVDHFEYLVTDDEVTGSIIIDEDVYETIEALDLANPLVDYSWRSIEVHDTVISVPADSIPYEDVEEDDIYFYGDDRFLFRAHHTFFLRAVDENGAHSVYPAYRTFTATTIAPSVTINHPHDIGGVGGYDGLPPDIFFRWTGNDSVGDGTVIEPDSTRFVLLNKGDLGMDQQSSGRMLSFPDSVWSKWRHWDEVDSLNENVGGKRTLITGLTPSASGGDEGYYLFFVQAKDEAGAITSHYQDGANLRKLRIVSSKQPLVVISETVLGHRVSSHDQTYDFTIAEDQPLELRWRANADDYGSEITGYRYGWDILDVANDEEWSSWSLSNTSTEASFVSGTHTFYMEARDYSGNTTRVLFRFTVVPFTMERDLLFIDDYSNLATENYGQAWPAGPPQNWGTFPHDNDDQKQFWDDILTEYAGYDPVVDFFRVTTVNPIPPFETVAHYQNLIWEAKEVAGGESGLARVSRFVDVYLQGVEVPFDYLGAFMDRGGQLFLCGVHPVFAMLPEPADMGPEDYERKGPMALLKHLKFSVTTDANEAIAAVQRFLPWRQFGVDAVVKPVDQAPKSYTWGGADMKTYRIFWGFDGAGYPGNELDAYPNTTNWAPADTLRFRPEVYDWLNQAGELFMGVEVSSGDLIDCGVFDCDDPPPYYGMETVEIYNWDFFGGTFNPPLDYRENQFIPFLTFSPSDETTRFGKNPTSAHPVWTAEYEPYDEASYWTGNTEHAIAVIGTRNPEAPSVLLGMVPYYLDPDEAQGLMDHVLIDLFGLQK
jgi:hypothetical protein